MWDVGIAVGEMNAAEGVVMAQFKMVVENELRMALCGQTVQQLSEAACRCVGLAYMYAPKGVGAQHRDDALVFSRRHLGKGDGNETHVRNGFVLLTVLG